MTDPKSIDKQDIEQTVASLLDQVLDTLEEMEAEKGAPLKPIACIEAFIANYDGRQMHIEND